MEKSSAITNYYAVVGGKHLVSQENWVLSLVRHDKKDHAYLILEGIDEQGNPFCHEAHLHIKEGTEQRYAGISYGEVDFDKLKYIGDKCHSYTWPLYVANEPVQDTKDRFFQVIEEQQRLSEENKINYVYAGNSIVNGSFESSLIALHLNKSHTASQNKSHNPSSDLLLRRGHNCCSWAEAIVQAVLKLEKLPQLTRPFIAVIPSWRIRGNNDGNEPRRACLVM